MIPKKGDIVCHVQDLKGDHPCRVLWTEQAFDPADRPIPNVFILVFEPLGEPDNWGLQHSGVYPEWIVTKSREEQIAERLMA